MVGPVVRRNNICCGLFLFLLVVKLNTVEPFSINQPMRDCVVRPTRSFCSSLEAVVSRRTLLETTTTSILPVAAAALAIQPENVLAAASAAASAEDAEEGLVSRNRVGDLLRAVPTFTIVDTRGVPYMVVGEDAKVTGYFFTTFGEAKRILDLAKTSSAQAIQAGRKELRSSRKAAGLAPLSAKEEEEEIGVNPWTQARISSVPLDFAVTLASKSGSGNNYFRVAPAESDIDDALGVTGKTSLAEGKVPLFYFRDFQLGDNDDKKKQSPLYFRKSELMEDWKRQNPGKDVPELLVSELFSVLVEMLKPGGTDQDLKGLVLVPPKESAAKAKDCNKAGGKEVPFLLGERNVVL